MDVCTCATVCASACLYDCMFACLSIVFDVFSSVDVGSGALPT